MGKNNEFFPSSRFYPQMKEVTIYSCISKSDWLMNVGKELFQDQEMVRTDVNVRAVTFMPTQMEPPGTIISNWAEIEHLVHSDKPMAEQIYKLLEASKLEQEDQEYKDRRSFALFNLLSLLNDKRRKTFDALFHLPSDTLGHRSENGEYELGFHGQTLVPFGLILALLRNDLEKVMNKAAPFMEKIFSDAVQSYPDRLLKFDTERRRYA